MTQTREFIFLCRQICVNSIIIFLNKFDFVKEEEMYELIKIQVKELLDKNKYDLEKSTFI
jgi:elongation factor Tu